MIERLALPWKLRGQRVYQVGPNSRAEYELEDGTRILLKEICRMAKAPLEK